MYGITVKTRTFKDALLTATIGLALLFLQGCELTAVTTKQDQPLVNLSSLNPEIQRLYRRINENSKETIRELRLKSDSGDSDASKLLGLIYLEGKYVKRDVSLGIQEFKRSASGGDKEAALILYKIFTTKKYIESHQSEAQEYGEIAGILQQKDYPASKTIARLKAEIEKNKWEDFTEKKGERASAFGSAVAINRNGDFLTNRHVVDGCRKVVVRYNNMLARVTAVSLGQEADVAVVKVAGITPAYLRFVNKKTDLGEKIYVGGYPLIDRLGADLKITDGLVSGISAKRPTMIQITASISSGNSGGPVVDEWNRIVAIATAGLRGSEADLGHGINFATHSEAILKFLRTNQVAYETREKSGAISSRDVAEFLKISTGLVVCIE
jgi:S1-C subfamily serine protease